jgi:small subunit ribosomal protein S13
LEIILFYKGYVLKVKYIYILTYEIILIKSIYSNLIKINGLNKLTIGKVLSKSSLHKFLYYKNIFSRRNWLIKLNLRTYLINLKLYLKIKDIYINWLITMNLYRGKRYVLKLPVRGQRTRTNARTSKILNGCSKI